LKEKLEYFAKDMDFILRRDENEEEDFEEFEVLYYSCRNKDCELCFCPFCYIKGFLSF